ncbi:MAG: PfkB family carbohydrate kinase [Herpetosiphon sp.]
MSGCDVRREARPFDVVVVGEVNPDLILRGEVTPVFGQVEQMIDDAQLVIGSSSAIFACGAARLGLRVAFIGKTGDDLFGSFMRQELAARGVDVRGIVVDPAIRTGLSVMLARELDRAILTYSGSIGALRYDEIDMGVIEQARHLHMGSFFMLEMLQPEVPRLFRAARALGLTVSLDTNYDPAERWDAGLEEVLQQVDLFLPNEVELLAISGEREMDRALERLGKRVPVMGVKRGAAGGIARRGSEVATAAGISVNVIDTTGAGDSFDAGFVYGYLHGWSLERTVRLACACGSLSTRAAGGTAAQATLAEAMAGA